METVLFEEWSQFPNEFEEVSHLRELKRYDEALAILKRIMDARPNSIMAKEVSSKIKGEWGDVLCRQGKYKEALALYDEIKEATDGDQDQPKLLAVNNNIALTLLEAGKYKESEKMFNEVIPKLIDAFGPDNLNTLASQSNFARVLDRLGKYKESLALYGKILARQKELSGPDNPVTLITQNNMGMVLLKTGKHEEALELFQGVFEAYKSQFGPEDPETLSVQNNVGKAFQHLHQFKEALKIFEYVYKVRKEKLGPNHPRTLATQHQMARVFGMQGRLPEAKKAFNEVHVGHRKVLDLDHPEAKIAKEGVGKLRQQAKTAEKPSDPQTLEEATKLARLYSILNSDLSAYKRESLNKLLEEGVHMEVAIDDGKTPLHMAVIKNENDIVLSLLQYTKRTYDARHLFNVVNAPILSTGTIPLHVAAQNGYLETMKTLLQHGAMYDFLNSAGQRPHDVAKCEKTKALLKAIDNFFGAVRKGDIETIKKLRNLKECELLAATNARNQRGYTLLQVSSSLKLREVSAELIKILKDRPSSGASTSGNSR